MKRISSTDKTGSLTKAEKEFKRGWAGATACINKGVDPFELLNQARTSLTCDDFNKGWKQCCEHALKLAHGTIKH